MSSRVFTEKRPRELAPEEYRTQNYFVDLGVAAIEVNGGVLCTRKIIVSWASFQFIASP